MKRLILLILVISVLLSNITAVNAFDISFTDVKSNMWFYENVMNLVNKGIVNGYEDGTFRPENTLLFEEFIKMVVVATSDEEIQAEQGSNWYKEYMRIAIENEYINLTMLVNIGRSITRENMAQILYNILKYNNDLPVINDSEYNALGQAFSDLTSSDKETLYIAKAGIITGYPDGSFKPNDCLKRSEASTVIMRLIDNSYRKEMTVTYPRTLDELPTPNLDYLRNYPTLYGRTIAIAYDDLITTSTNATSLANDIHSNQIFYDILLNRDYRTINKPITNTIYVGMNEVPTTVTWGIQDWLLHYFNASREYRGSYYYSLRSSWLNDPMYNSKVINWFENFTDKWVQDAIDNKVVVEGKYYTDKDMVSIVDGGYASRGILRFKYTSHLHPENIKEELDLVFRYCAKDGMSYVDRDASAWDIYIDYDDIPAFKVGIWYEIGVDVVNATESPFPGVEDRLGTNISYWSVKYLRPIYIKEIGK